LNLWSEKASSGGSKKVPGCTINQAALKIFWRRWVTMKIAVTSTGNELISDMDPRFGRAKCFLIIDPQTLEYDIAENRQNLSLPQGAGIQAAKTIVDQQADVLISGNCGPKAFKVLNAAGIKIVTGAKGRVIDAVLQYQSGELMAVSEPNVEGHWV
jgi:predicted Fe-Mo cluster-binding NifX family protein